MHELVLSGALAAALATLFTSALVPLVTRISLSVRAVDYPGGRRVHRQPIPRLGGIALAGGLLLGGGAVVALQWSRWGERVGAGELGVFALAAALVFAVGLLDDTMGVTPAKKLLVEVLAAGMVVLAGWRFTSVALPGGQELELGWFGWVLSLLWIVGATNAINLIDGLDGLAGGVAAIIAGSLLVVAALHGNLFTVVLMAAVVGSCLGFLRHNWHPARIFMGDSGSLTLGFLLAAISVHASLKASAAVAILVPILALGLPVVDTLLVMAVRFLERPQGPAINRVLRMFKADRNHLHHLVLNLRPSRRHAVLVIYGLTLIGCLAALTVAFTRDPVVGVALLGLEVAVVLGVRSMGLAQQVRRLAHQQRGEVRERYLGAAEASLGESATRRARRARGEEAWHLPLPFAEVQESRGKSSSLTDVR